MWLYYVDELAELAVASPTFMEFVQETYPFPEQVERTVYGQIKWSF